MNKVNWIALLGALIALSGLAMPWTKVQGQLLSPTDFEAIGWAWSPLFLLSVTGVLGAFVRVRFVTLALLVLGFVGALIALMTFKSAVAVGLTEPASYGFWLTFLGNLLLSAGSVARLAGLKSDRRATRIMLNALPPAALPCFFFMVWEGAIIGLRVPIAFFPSVSDVIQVLLSSHQVLIADSVHTFVRQLLFGYLLGVAMALLAGMLIAMSPFLRRGFLPLATAFSAIPVVGLAPVLGRAFGIDWESKAAVACIVSFFPMLVNVVQGLTIIDPRQMDLLRAYAATRSQVFRKLRFPNALPYLFSALKITSIISLISVIVAEFLIPGPPDGLGQRISLSARSGRYDITFAAIAFASIIGILFYYFIALLERIFTRWHSSFRTREGHW
jgi:NitT/TauT family transport system permease protein